MHGLGRVHRSLAPHLLQIVFLDRNGPNIRLVAICSLGFTEAFLQLESVQSPHVDVHLQLVLVPVIALSLGSDISSQFIGFSARYRSVNVEVKRFLQGRFQ